MEQEEEKEVLESVNSVPEVEEKTPVLPRLDYQVLDDDNGYCD